MGGTLRNYLHLLTSRCLTPLVWANTLFCCCSERRVLVTPTPKLGSRGYWGGQGSMGHMRADQQLRGVLKECMKYVIIITIIATP